MSQVSVMVTDYLGQRLYLFTLRNHGTRWDTVCVTSMDGFMHRMHFVCGKIGICVEIYDAFLDSVETSIAEFFFSLRDHILLKDPVGHRRSTGGKAHIDKQQSGKLLFSFSEKPRNPVKESKGGVFVLPQQWQKQ